SPAPYDPQQHSYPTQQAVSGQLDASPPVQQSASAQPYAQPSPPYAQPNPAYAQPPTGSPYAPPQMPQGGAPSGYAPQHPGHYAQSPGAPQPTADAPSQPHAVPPGASTADPNTTLRTRGTEDGLDKPPKNMLPIYALIGLVVIAAAVVAIILATR
ncbi:MAG TPA: hypothetical protein VIV40_33635, partial [Kofleriaceae bacterium]